MSSIIRATTTSGLQVAPDNSGSLQLQTNGTTAAVTIDTSQNTTFAGKVTSAGALTLASNGTTTALTIDTSQNVAIGASSAINSGTRVTVNGTNQIADSFGNMYVGTTNSQAINLGGQITIGGSWNGTSQTVFGAIAGRKESSTNAEAKGYLQFSTLENSVQERMRIDSSGGLILAGSTAQKATGTTWSNPSDQRLKDNIRDYTKGTTELMQVRVREWEYNGKGGTTQGTKGLGVVADEVMTVLPNTVETYDAKLNTNDENNTAIKKFDATEITWLLVKTVQEQQTIINDLKARIETLEAN
jgi:hypothetical protein